jgi:hypothetical protein
MVEGLWIRQGYAGWMKNMAPFEGSSIGGYLSTEYRVIVK